MQYKVVDNNSLQKLIGLVNQEIQKGWKPLGGIAVAGFGIMMLFYQAMVKEQETRVS